MSTEDLIRYSCRETGLDLQACACNCVQVLVPKYVLKRLRLIVSQISWRRLGELLKSWTARGAHGAVQLYIHRRLIGPKYASVGVESIISGCEVSSTANFILLRVRVRRATGDSSSHKKELLGSLYAGWATEILTSSNT